MRTNKFRLDGATPLLQNKFSEMLFGVGLLASTLILVPLDFVLAPAGALLMATGRFAIFRVEAQLKKSEADEQPESSALENLDLALETEPEREAA